MRRFLYTILWLASAIVPRAQITPILVPATPDPRGGESAYSAFNKINGNEAWLQTNNWRGVNLLARGADRTGVTNAATILSDAIAEASGLNGEVYVPAGTYSVSSLDVTNSNFRLTGPGRVVCSGIVTNWLKLTGTNIQISGPKFDGQNKAQVILTAGPYSTDWDIEKSTIQNARVTDANDPNGSATTGSATAAGFKMMVGCKRIKIRNNYFISIAYDGIKDSSVAGTGRVARGIHAAPFPAATTEADAITDIEASGNWFLNADADKSKVDCDAAVFQNQLPANIPDSRIKFSGNYILNWGWRGGKFQVGGVEAADNTIISGTAIAYGATDVDGYHKAMTAGLDFFGSNNKVRGNKIRGGSIGRPISIDSTDTFGRSTNNIVSDNVVMTDPTLNANSYSLNFESIEGGTIHGNVVNSGYFGIYLRGACENLAVSANTLGNNGFAAIYCGPEAQANTWTNLSPTNVTIAATLVKNGLTWGVNVGTGSRDVTVTGTQGGAALSLVVYATGATGELAANKGAIQSAKSTTANANYYWRADATAASTGSVKFFGPFENAFETYDDNVGGISQLSLGRATGNTILAGTVFFGTSRKLVNGTGSPEGTVTATVGSIYTRIDGGAGTTLYVKESGTGNTGWVAK